MTEKEERRITFIPDGHATEHVDVSFNGRSFTVYGYKGTRLLESVVGAFLEGPLDPKKAGGDNPPAEKSGDIPF
jgi:hypothetical protein